MTLPGAPFRRVGTNTRRLLPTNRQPTSAYHFRVLPNTTFAHHRHLRTFSFQDRHRFAPTRCSSSPIRNFETMASATTFFDFKVKDSKLIPPFCPFCPTNPRSLAINPQPRHRAAQPCLALPCLCQLQRLAFLFCTRLSLGACAPNSPAPLVVCVCRQRRRPPTAANS